MLQDVNALVGKMATEIREAAMLGAMAYNAVHGLQSDDISENQAFDKYGRGWVLSNTKRGAIHFTRNGSSSRSTKIYSIFEIETLKRAEKCIETMYNAAIAKTLNENE